MARVKWHARHVVRVAENAIELAGDRTSEDVRRRAMNMAPQDTGKLRGSIKVEVRKGMFGDLRKWRVVASGGAGNRNYAAWQELGTKRNKKQPFLRPAFYGSKQWILEQFRKALS